MKPLGGMTRRLNESLSRKSKLTFLWTRIHLVFCRPYLHNGEPIPADVVIEDIQSMPTLTLQNDPVTLEQLLEMDGEWITIKAFDTEIAGTMPAFVKDGFATSLCELKSRTVVPGVCEVHFPFSEYEKTWLAYRRAPEGEED